MNVGRPVSFWKPTTSGNGIPASSYRSRISSTAVWDSNPSTTRPQRVSTPAMPPVNSVRRWANSTPSIGGGPDFRQGGEGIRAAQGQAGSTNPSLGLLRADAHVSSGMPSSVRSSQRPLAASSANS